MRTARGGAANRARWTPSPILMLPDGADGTRRLRYTGPGALLVSVAHERQSANGLRVRLGLRPHVIVRRRPNAGRPASGTVILLDGAARLSVR